MTVPLLFEEGGMPFKRIGLAHVAIAPYGVFKTRDGADILISIQNDREWRVLAEKVLGDAALGSDPRFATNPKRVENRAATDAKVATIFAGFDVTPLMQKLEDADIAFARVSDTALLSRHPHLRRITSARRQARSRRRRRRRFASGEERSYGPVPALGEHSDKIRAEFMPRKRA